MDLQAGSQKIFDILSDIGDILLVLSGYADGILPVIFLRYSDNDAGGLNDRDYLLDFGTLHAASPCAIYRWNSLCEH